LRNVEEPVAVRMAALQALGALDFLGPRFAPFRADYKQALRDVATDPVPELRESAIELLAIARDPYAQELLLRGLRRPLDAVVPEAKAIQYLGYDDHANVAQLVRRLFRRTEGAAREEALRLLATDPRSTRLLARILKDKSESPSIRALSASGLQSLSPETFERAAPNILADDDDHDDVKATVVAALAHGREAREKAPDAKVLASVRELGDRTRSAAVRAAVQHYLRSTES
jgi:hypothetical protein